MGERIRALIVVLHLRRSFTKLDEPCDRPTNAPLHNLKTYAECQPPLDFPDGPIGSCI